MRFALALPLLAVVACNAYSPPPLADAGGPTGDPTQLAVDAPAHDFANVVVGAVSTTAGVRVINRGDLVSGELAIALGDEFMIVADGCTGVALAPGDGCDLAVAFAPTTEGAHQATLAVTGRPGEEANVALTGVALAPGDLHADVSMHSFADTRLGVQSDELAITITNDGDEPSGVMTAALGDGAHYLVTTDTCSGSPLPSDATCTIGVRFAPVGVGVHTTSVTIGATPGGQTAVSLGGTGVAEVAVTTIGSGGGTVTSSPPAIDCGATCTALVGSSAVSLSATADASSLFLGWTGACSGTGICNLDVTADTAVSARFEGPQSLTIVQSGSGGGTITSAPAGIDCGGDCAEDFPYGSVVTLTAVAQTGSTFAGWSGGGCSGTGGCQVTLTSATTVTAAFSVDAFAVNVSRTGTGTGTVTSSPAGINCGADCIEAYAFGTIVTLTAAPATGSTFTGWSGGGCTGTGACHVTVNSIVSVTASFTLDQYTLVVNKSGTGAGTVTSAPGISCGTDCSEVYDFGTVVTLSASAATGSTFTGWSGGGCSGTGTCQVTIGAATTVTAGFSLNQYVLTVGKTGTGTGTVSSSGINCGTDCTESYPYNTVVTLTAAPAVGSTFTSWSGGGCSGTGTCQVTMTAATTVTATFTVNTYALTVGTGGPGAGTVTSSPAGISCGADCSEAYAHGTTVTLTATPAAGSSFGGWSGGGCSGTGTCAVTMTSVTLVTATFNQTPFQLTVVRGGTGTGTVTGTGIACGTDCTEVVTSGTTIALTASAATGSTFTGWSGGGCSGTGTCSVTVNAATTVTATFTLNQYTLTVSKAGNGAGTVSASPAGISCGADCSESYGHGTVVTLTAVPATGSNFTGWSGGGCSGTGTCTVTMTAATSITATFTLQLVGLTTDMNGTGTGHIVGTGISCFPDCSETYPYGTVVTLSALPDSGKLFTGWSGACSGSSPTCTVTMTGATSVVATFSTAWMVNISADIDNPIDTSPNGGTCTGACAYAEADGTTVHVHLDVGSDYVFTGWSTGVCGTQGISCSFTIHGPVAIHAFVCDVGDICCINPHAPSCDF